MQWDGLIGQDPGYVASELQRRITEALKMDDRVRGISGFTYAVEGDMLRASLTVSTVYGEMQTSVRLPNGDRQPFTEKINTNAVSKVYTPNMNR